MKNDNTSILIVDDNPKNIQLLASMLKEDGFRISYATDGAKALKVLNERYQDLVLMDVMMPEMDGISACRRMQQDPKLASIPVIFLTARTDEESISQGFEAGGVDYVTKPFNKKELLVRIKTQIQLYEYRHHLESKVQELTQEIELTQREVIFTMGMIGETRSKETGNHVKRVAEYSYLLAKLYGLPDQEAELLRDASPMHDIGKVGIPDSILHKPAKLDRDEWAIMQRHSQLGYDLMCSSPRAIMRSAAIVALEHHEKWNGEGYPRGLKGEEIHIFGRIVALADVFDALGSERCYKKAWPDKEVFQFIKEQSGHHFEPKLVELFFEHLEEFIKIRENFSDEFLI